MKKILNHRENFLFFFLLLTLFGLSLFQWHFEIQPRGIETMAGNLAKITSYSFWNYTTTYSIYALAIYLSPFLIAVVASSGFHKIFHSGYMDYLFQRSPYRKVFSREVLKSYLTAFILPLLNLIILGVGKIFYRSSPLSPAKEANGLSIFMVKDSMYEMSPVLFIILHCILLFLFSLIVINISLILTRWIKNKYLSSLSTLMILIGLEIVGMVAIGPLLSSLLGKEEIANLFSLYNTIYLDAIPGLAYEFIFSIALFVITTGILYWVYCRKLGNYDEI